MGRSPPRLGKSGGIVTYSFNFESEGGKAVRPTPSALPVRCGPVSIEVGACTPIGLFRSRPLNAAVQQARFFTIRSQSVRQTLHGPEPGLGLLRSGGARLPPDRGIVFLCLSGLQPRWKNSGERGSLPRERPEKEQSVRLGRFKQGGAVKGLLATDLQPRGRP
jgi:hypothetical protein